MMRTFELTACDVRGSAKLDTQGIIIAIDGRCFTARPNYLTARLSLVMANRRFEMDAVFGVFRCHFLRPIDPFLGVLLDGLIGLLRYGGRQLRQPLLESP